MTAEPATAPVHGVRPELLETSDLAPWADLLPYPGNAKLHDEEAIAESLNTHGQFRPLVVQRSTRRVLAGNGTYAAAGLLGWTHVAVQWLDCDDAAARKINLADNRTSELGGGYDDGLLRQLLEDLDGDFAGTGFAPADLDGMLEQLARDAAAAAGKGPNLAERFLAPPFTVLDARAGWWQDRKRQWLALGLQSEIGRGENLLNYSDRAILGKRKAEERAGKITRALGFYQPGAGGSVVQRGTATESWTGTSIFDPVLCELLLRWFAPPAGRVLDPYAGGSVRGIIAGRLGLHYVGVELRPEQVAANREQIAQLLDGQPGTADYLEGDAGDRLPELEPDSFDAILTCPPYYDLERYSDDPRDLSAMTREAFDQAYAAHIAAAARALKPGRFAAIVVGNVRDPDGRLRDLAGLTTRAAEAAGLTLYNDAVLVTALGSVPLRAGKHFASTRVLGRAHQQVLVYVKGDRREAADACGPVEVADALRAAEGEIGATDDAPLEQLPGPQLEEEPPEDTTDDPEALTPWEDHGGIAVKRDDLFEIAGSRGGKVRTCLALAQQAVAARTGLITAGSRHSPQVRIVAGIAAQLGLPCRVHVPAGKTTPELEEAAELGAELIQHRPGYNTVIVARAAEDAEASGWTLIPFGMEHPEAIRQTARQAARTFAALDRWPARIVVPIGSGMSAAGILQALAALPRDAAQPDTWGPPLLGIVVGADPTKRLDTYAPAGWRDHLTLIPSGSPYEQPAPQTRLGQLELDPHYEAKCLPHLQPRDLLWVVGRRATAG